MCFIINYKISSLYNTWHNIFDYLFYGKQICTVRKSLGTYADYYGFDMNETVPKRYIERKT